MPKTICPQCEHGKCEHGNSSYIRYCMSCGCCLVGLADDDYVSVSSSQAVEDLFKSSLKKIADDRPDLFYDDDEFELPVKTFVRKSVNFSTPVVSSFSNEFNEPVLLESPVKPSIMQLNESPRLGFSQNAVGKSAEVASSVWNDYNEIESVSKPPEKPPVVHALSELPDRVNFANRNSRKAIKLKEENYAVDSRPFDFSSKYVNRPADLPSVRSAYGAAPLKSPTKEKKEMECEVIETKQATIKQELSHHCEVPLEVQKPSLPPLIPSNQNPYFSNKKELEDYLSTNFSNLESCNFGSEFVGYQSVSLRDSFAANRLQQNDESAVSYEDEVVEDERDRVADELVVVNNSLEDDEMDIDLPPLQLFSELDLEPMPEIASSRMLRDVDYGRFFQLTPRITRGDDSMLLSLPNEMLLYILSQLSQPELVIAMQVCKKLSRFASDYSLWRSITLRNKTLEDPWMLQIGQKKPQTLALVCCDGVNLSSSSLAEMFRSMGSLLGSFTCHASFRGALDTDNVILRLAGQCGPSLRKLSVAWSSVTDVGMAIVDASFPNLTQIDLSGCQLLSDKAVTEVIASVGKQLLKLVLSQNVKLSAETFTAIATHCSSLQHLELNFFQTLQDGHIDAIVSSISRTVRVLSLEHCKRISDVAVLAICESCKNLETLNLGKNKQLTRQCLHFIAEHLPLLKTLNITLLLDVADDDLSALAKGVCKKLESIDCTRLRKITTKGVLAFVYACPSLRAITLMNCSKVDRDHVKNDQKLSSLRIAVVV